MNEIWIPIPGWEGSYEVSDQGRVRSLDRVVMRRNGIPMRRAGALMNPCTAGRTKHQRISLSDSGRRYNAWVHRLVLEAFVGPAPDGMHCCHANDIAEDNRLENLRWDTPRSNREDSVRNGRHHNASKKFCMRGHDITQPENVYFEGVRRHCRPCKLQREKARRARKVGREL